VILLDANLLIYAYDASSPFHNATRQWLEETIESEPMIGLPWISILAFLRITTHPRLPHRQTLALAIGIVDDWLELPNVRVVAPGERHWTTLKKIATDGQVRGALVTDASLAALAIEHGATLCSNDQGFRRFPALKFFNPLAS
jgi:toxin-antitoxin system PIN domain toxin